ncbi:MAG: S49 family peptidase [Chloroflexota bacterium]|nr:MAG: S49 family peptidase [Chloroflexota bacterium]
MAEENNGPEHRRSPLQLIMTFLGIVVLPLVLGLYLAPRLVPEPKIGVVHLNYDIFGDTAAEIGAQLAYARQDPAFKAVVLAVNSPGGSAAYSEELFLDVLNTREQMPVVASVDLMAASGAYYVAAAADEIYAKPTSNVGSIGVIAILPGPVFLDDELITTGPYKAFGGTQDSTLRQMEMAKFAFLEAVASGRGERLQVDPEVLSRAEIFSGVQAEEMGLIDGLTSGDQAVRRAAELAGLEAYELVELLPLALPETLGDEPAEAYRPSAVDPAALWAPPEDLPAGLYFRYIEPPPAG